MALLQTITWSWRIAHFLFYATSALLALAFLARKQAPGPLRVLQPLARRIDAVGERVEPRHVLLFMAPFFALFAALLVLTVREPAWPGLVDFRTAWVPWGARAAQGGNPYVSPDSIYELSDFSNALNFGLVYAGILALGYALGGAVGIAILFELLAFLTVFVLYLVARDLTKDKTLATWIFLIAFFLPMCMLFEVREVQDEMITPLGGLVILFLVSRSRLYWGALAAGFFTATKYLPLILFAAFLAVHFRAATRGQGPIVRRVFSAPTFRTYLPPFLLAVAVFAATEVLGYLLYGQAFLSRTIFLDRLENGGKGVSLMRMVLPILGAQLLNRVFYVAVAVACAWLLFRPGPTRTDGQEYLQAAILPLLVFLFVSPWPEPDSVVFVIPFLLFLLAWRGQQLDAAPGPADVVASVLLAVAASVLVDVHLLLKPVFHLPVDGLLVPFPLQVVYTVAMLVMTWATFRVTARPRDVRTPTASRPSS